MKAAPTTVDKIISLPVCQAHLNKSDGAENGDKENVVQVAYPNAFDGLRPLVLIEDFLERPRPAGHAHDNFDGTSLADNISVDFKVPVHMHMIDAWTKASDQGRYDAGHDSVMIKKNAQLSVHRNILDHITLETITEARDVDQQQEDFYKLYNVSDNSYDVVLTNMYIYHSRVMGFQCKISHYDDDDGDDDEHTNLSFSASCSFCSYISSSPSLSFSPSFTILV